MKVILIILSILLIITGLLPIINFFIPSIKIKNLNQYINRIILTEFLGIFFLFISIFVKFSDKDYISPITLSLFIVYYIYIIVEKYYVDYLRSRIKYVIHVNGIRGKSTTTRLIDAGLRGCGFKVFSKTTGTKPVYIDTNNVDHEIKRMGPANIREQIKMLKMAADEHADCVVLECMAVNPELQRVSQYQILNADVVVITNVRADHIQDMGDTLEDIARAFCLTLPTRGQAVIGNNDFDYIFNKECVNHNTKRVELVDYNEDDLMDTFKENIVLALTVAKTLNLDLTKYLSGMKSYHHDYGSFEEIKVNNTILLNGFSINDPTSIKMVYDKIIQKYDQDKLTILLNSRVDRPTRVTQHIELLKDLEFNNLLLIGSNIEYVYKHIKANLPDKSIIKIKNIEELFDYQIIFGIGNIGGKGMEILEYFRKNRNDS